jgi:hypothetical protein
LASRGAEGEERQTANFVALLVVFLATRELPNLRNSFAQE